MAIRYQPSRTGIGETSVVAVEENAFFDEVANAILEKAKALAAEDDELAEFAAALKVEKGVRPKGRGYVRVTADVEDAAALEWGDTATARRRILGQAAGVQVTSGD